MTFDDDDDDDVAYFVAAANANAIVAIDLVLIAFVVSVDVDLVIDPPIGVTICAAPPKPHEQCSHPRSPYHYGRRSSWRRCSFSSSSSSFLTDPATNKAVVDIRQSRAA